MDKIKVYLTKDEKAVIRHIVAYGAKQPSTFSPVMFMFILSSLKDKGLIEYRSDYMEVHAIKFTVKGAALLESNPNLDNPIDWVKWLTLGSAIVTAIATTLALIIQHR